MGKLNNFFRTQINADFQDFKIKTYLKFILEKIIG